MEHDRFKAAFGSRSSHRRESLRLAIGAGLLIALSTLGMAGAHAQASSEAANAPTEASEGQVRVKLTQVLVVEESGKEVLREVDTVKPGDLIEYRAVYTNKGDTPVTGLVASLPLAEGLEYVPRSARPGAPVAQAAARDGKYMVEPLTRLEPGAKVPKPVPYAEYRALRWMLPKLAPGASAEYSVRARIASSSAADAPVSVSGLQPVVTSQAVKN